MSTLSTTPSTSPMDVVGESFRTGWATFKAFLGPTYIVLIVYFLVILVLSGIGLFLRGGDPQNPSSLYWLWSLAETLISFPLAAGLSWAMVKIVRSEGGEAVPALFAGFRRYVPVFVSTLLVGIAVVVGLILFIIPGIFLGCGLWAAPLLVLDQGHGGVDSLKASWAMMNGYKLAYFVFGIVAAVVIAIGFALCGVGAIVAVPIVALAYGAFYNRVLALNPPPAPAM
jgi:uncharacterized membrane protein